MYNFNLYILIFFSIFLNNSNKKIIINFVYMSKEKFYCFWSQSSFIKGKNSCYLSTGDIYNKLFKILLSISKRESQCHSFATTKIKVKPLVDTGVKQSLGMQFIIQTHVCAKNSTNVWVLLIVGNIRSLCGKQLCHYVYIYSQSS